jgi:hypothetical protein
MYKFFLFFITLISLISCVNKVQNHKYHTGEVHWRDRYMDNLTKSYYNEDSANHTKVLFKDSITICNVWGIFGFTDTNGVRRQWDSVIGYAYADRLTKSFYFYPSLDPNCKFTEKWYDDSIGNIGHVCGWAYFKYWNETKIKDYKNISDTTINGKVYKRIRGQELVDCTDGIKRYLIETGFLLCERKGTIFHMDRLTDDKEGCPMVMYQKNLEGSRAVFCREIEFIDRPLTDFELKLFAAWEKNARENPVK